MKLFKLNSHCCCMARLLLSIIRYSRNIYALNGVNGCNPSTVSTEREDIDREDAIHQQSAQSTNPQRDGLKLDFQGQVPEVIVIVGVVGVAQQIPIRILLLIMQREQHVVNVHVVQRLMDTYHQRKRIFVHLVQIRTVNDRIVSLSTNASVRMFPNTSRGI